MVMSDEDRDMLETVARTDGRTCAEAVRYLIKQRYQRIEKTRAA